MSAHSAAFVISNDTLVNILSLPLMIGLSFSTATMVILVVDLLAPFSLLSDVVKEGDKSFDGMPNHGEHVRMEMVGAETDGVEMIAVDPWDSQVFQT